MPPEKQNPPDVANPIIQELINLLYHHYPKAKQAILNLESSSDNILLASLMDLRDFIDHIYLALGQDLDKQKIDHHVASAEEHLRRAIAEPYHVLVQDKLEEIKELYNTYKKSPFRFFGFLGVSEIITMEEARKKLLAIREKLNEGRLLKSKSIWSEEFEKAIQECYIPAYDIACELCDKLFKACDKSAQWTANLTIGIIASGIIFLFGVGLKLIWRSFF